MGRGGKNRNEPIRIAAFDPATLVNARASPLPETIDPEVASMAETVPTGDAWLYETKLDGYRLLARLSGSTVRFFDRYQQEWELPALAKSIVNLSADSALLDGELVALQPDGTTNFRQLQEAVARGSIAQLVYEAFDLLYFDGYDLTGVDLVGRKRALKLLVAGGGAMPNRGRIRYVHHFEGNGAELFDEICRLGLAGIVCKLRSSGYRGGRSVDWIEVRPPQRIAPTHSERERPRATFVQPRRESVPRLVPTVTLRHQRKRASRADLATDSGDS